jgi:hypothetical protein
MPNTNRAPATALPIAFTARKSLATYQLIRRGVSVAPGCAVPHHVPGLFAVRAFSQLRTPSHRREPFARVNRLVPMTFVSDLVTLTRYLVRSELLLQCNRHLGFPCRQVCRCFYDEDLVSNR